MKECLRSTGCRVLWKRLVTHKISSKVKLNMSLANASPTRELILLTIALDMPPGVNNLYQPVIGKDRKTGKQVAKIIKSKACNEWANYAAYQVRLQRSGLTIPYRFIIKMSLAESLHDSDAFTKETLDACQHGGAIVNDKHCRGGMWEVDETRPRGTMLVDLIETEDPIPPAMLRRLEAERNQPGFFG